MDHWVPETDLRAAGRGPHRQRHGTFLIETRQNLLQTKAAVDGCKQAIVTRSIRLPNFVDVTVETTATMLMGSRSVQRSPRSNPTASTPSP